MIKQQLVDILQCPVTGNPLSLRDGRLCSEGVSQYRVVDGVPVFLPDDQNAQIHDKEHFSNDICTDAQQVVRSTRGLVLNLSAGGSRAKATNVIELEYSIFRNTDVVGDAHTLPFKDGVFDACICMNAFEHYRDPKRAAEEIRRVLKPGGTLFMHTAGLQPLHEPPHHYFNVTKFGLAQWLDGFDIEHIRVSDNFNPAYGLAWIIAELERGIRIKQGRWASLLMRRTSLGRVMKFWTNPDSRKGVLWDMLQKLDNETQETVASGWEARVRKPLV